MVQRRVSIVGWHFLYFGLEMGHTLVAFAVGLILCLNLLKVLVLVCFFAGRLDRVKHKV